MSGVGLAKFGIGSLLVLLLTAMPVFGDDASSSDTDDDTAVETEAEREKTYMKIGDMVVTEKAGYLTSADAPGSVSVIGTDQLELENVNFTMQALKKLPGVFYQDWGQGVIHGTISLRGFDPNSDTAARLNVDGIPSNLASGFMDMRAIAPFEIERIELVKGTFDPRFGLGYVGGNVNVVTRRGGNYTKIKLLTGSHDTYEMNTVVAREKDNFAQTYFLSYRDTAGYREHSDLQKGSMSGKWFYTANDGRLSVGLVARFFSMDANAPGYLSKEQFDEDPTQMQSFSRTDGGEQTNQQTSLHLDYDFTHALNWSFKVYRQSLERSRWARFSSTGSQQERRTEETQYGAISTLNYETTDWGVERLTLTWGVDYQRQDDIYQRYTTVDRVRQGAAYTDYDYSQGYLGSFFQADSKVLRWLRLNGAMRVDYLFGDFEDVRNNVEKEMIDYGAIWQPKAGMVISPWEGYNLFANYGRTFQVSWTDRFAEEGSTNDTDVAQNDGWEVGFKATPVQWLAGRIAYWQQVRSNEVVYNMNGDPENLGETERKGVDLEINLKPHAWVTLWGSYSMVSAQYKNPGPTNMDRQGKDLKNIPDNGFKTGLDVVHPSGISGHIWLEQQSDYYIDYLNELPKMGGYEVVNLDLNYALRDITLGLQVKNLLDEKYAAFIWYNQGGTPEIAYAPGEERSFYAYVTLNF